MSTRSRFTAAAAVAALTASLLAGTPGLPASAQQPPAQIPTQAGRTDGPGRPDGRDGPGTHTVTLITGDRVLVGAGKAGRERVTFVPGRTNPSDSIQILRRHNRTYVIPSAARSLLRKLDPRLFDVTTLVAQEYDDRHLKSLPLIVQYAGKPPAGAPKGAARAETLGSISATAVRADKRTTATFWRELQRGKGVERVWLDRKVRASLDRSVPQVGAPQAWAKGLDGKGVTIAVVDTGVDATHPDLRGRVVAAENFSAAADAVDRAGHGTHVASIAAGTGAAVGGRYKGVAPAAELVSAKVLDDDGYGFESDVIEGMEWAVAQGANVVNLSLGTGPTDGTGPADLAVDELTEQSGALFVISAGNDGPSSVSSPSTADAALSVGAVDRDESLAPFSGVGPRKTNGAIKPEITAPGVGIVAAKAEGTELGEPVGDHYVALDGTSMAAPHVAGAAAILAQRHPDWNSDRLKAGLMSTARPNGTNTIYEQGAGRVDVSHAVDTVVHASAGKLEFGYVRWPHDNPAPITRELTYTNDSADPVDLDLSVSANDVPAAAWTLSTRALTVPAHGSATVRVTLSLDGLEPAHYGGVLTAQVAGTGEVLHTPVGWYLEPELYDVTVKGIDHSGNPSGDLLTVVDVDDGEWYSEEPFIGFDNGVAKLRVPPGKYSFGADLQEDPTDTAPLRMTQAVQPEVDVRGDTTVVLDGRLAEPVTIDVRDAPKTSSRTLGMGYTSASRQAGPAGYGGSSVVMWDLASQLFATPTEPALTSDFEFAVASRKEAPPITLDVVDGPAVRFEPRAMPFAPRFNGRARLPVVDFQPGDDAKGAVALIRRTAGTEPGPQAAEAARAGAKLALVYSDDRPGQWTEWCCGAEEPPIPIATTNRVAAAQLKALLAKGPVQLDVQGAYPTPFVYDLAVPVSGKVPDDPRFVVDPKQLARLDTTFGAHVPLSETSETRVGTTPMGLALDPWLLPLMPSPQRRTDYVQAGPVRWSQTVLPKNLDAASDVSSSEVPRTYRPGQKEKVRWFHPAATHSLPDNHPWYVARRTGTALEVWISGFADQPDRADDSFGDTHRIRLYSGDRLLADEAGNGLWMDVPEGPATYRLELDSSRSFDWWKYSTNVSSAWTVKSGGGDEEERLPLLLVSYDVPTADASGQVRAGDLVPVELALRHQSGSAGAKPRSVAFAQSYDDGATWQPLTVLRVSEGRYVAVVRHAGAQAGKAVSLRVEAADAEGNRLVQTVTKAYGIR